MKHLFPASTPVDLASFILLEIDRRQRGQINNCTPAYMLPYIRRNEDCPEKRRLQQHRNPLTAEKYDNIVDDAVTARKILDHTANNDKRNKMR
ncbi:hypothetical protein D3C75_1259540 [compost metagenome]